MLDLIQQKMAPINRLSALRPEKLVFITPGRKHLLLFWEVVLTKIRDIGDASLCLKK